MHSNKVFLDNLNKWRNQSKKKRFNENMDEKIKGMKLINEFMSQITY